MEEPDKQESFGVAIRRCADCGEFALIDLDAFLDSGEDSPLCHLCYESREENGLLARQREAGK